VLTRTDLVEALNELRRNRRWVKQDFRPSPAGARRGPTTQLLTRTDLFGSGQISKSPRVFGAGESGLRGFVVSVAAKTKALLSHVAESDVGYPGPGLLQEFCVRVWRPALQRSGEDRAAWGSVDPGILYAEFLRTEERCRHLFRAAKRSAASGLW
jgi:hypothetical protein